MHGEFWNCCSPLHLFKKYIMGLKDENISHISFSQIACGKCLYRYKKIYIDKEIKRESLLMQEGKIVHEAIKEYSKECLNLKIESDYEIMSDIIQEIIDKEKITEEMKLEIREILLNFAENVIDYEKILDFEKEFRIDLDTGTIEGVIDRINSYRDQDGLRVIEFIDYKNSFKVMSAQEVEDNLQLRIYRYIGCNELYKGNDLVRIGIHNTRINFIRFGEFHEVLGLQKEFERMSHYLNEQWKRLKESKEYPPEISNACLEYGGCPVMTEGKCPLYSKEAIKKMIESESIIDNVRAIRKLKIDCNNEVLNLKDYFKTNEPIDVDGKSVGFISNKSYKYLLEELMALSNEYDVVIDGLRLNKTDVEKLFKRAFGKEKFISYLEKLNKIETCSNTFKI